jgi:cytosine/adenosine deaminase-related metal-dependent hydrolase
MFGSRTGRKQGRWISVLRVARLSRSRRVWRRRRKFYDAGGRVACGGLIETHIHLDKSRIIDRAPPETGRKISPMKQVAVLKSGFTIEDAHAGRGRPCYRVARI